MGNGQDLPQNRQAKHHSFYPLRRIKTRRLSHPFQHTSETSSIPCRKNLTRDHHFLRQPIPVQLSPAPC
nr:hypothetical protein Iba_chr14aCG8470 [Ipomoea batatas]